MNRLLIKTAIHFFLYAILILLTACDQDNHSSIRFGLSAAPVTLDPRFATDAISQRIDRLIYQRLVDFDDQYHVVPDLADWKQVSPVCYRFHLRNANTRFQNGDALTSSDIKATYDSVLDEKTLSPHRSTISNIQRMQIIDDQTIDFYLAKPDPLFPGRLVIGIMPHKLLQANHRFSDQPLGSGPFRFVEKDGEERLVLERTRDGQRFEFLTVKDSTVRVLKLIHGEIDLIQGDLPFEMLAWLRDQPGIQVNFHPGNIFTYIGFNMRDPNLSKTDIRRAIALSIDRESIIRYVLGNAARKAGTLLPPTHWAAASDLQGYSYDPEQARQLLAKNGINKQHPLQMIYKTSNNPLRVRLATIIQYQLQQVGIDVRVQSHDWGTFYADIKQGRFQLYSLSWVGLNMPDVFRYVFHSQSLPPNGANRGFYQDQHVDNLIEQAELTDNLQAQAVIYRELQQYLYQQVVYIPLWYEDNLLAASKNINGYVMNADGDYDGLVNVSWSQH